MKNSKLFTAIAILIVMILMVTGCGSDSGKTSEKSEPQSLETEINKEDTSL